MSERDARYQHIQLTMGEGVATIMLDRPASLNALHLPLLDELLDALERLASDGAARALIVTGAGRAFCSGADLTPGAWEGAAVGGEGDAGTILETHLNPLLGRWFALPMPIVTAVNGAAAGAGCSLALAGDIVLAGRSAYFLQAFSAIGLVPDTGSTWLLPRLIGRTRALTMMLLADRVPAERALSWGMVSELVEDGDLSQRAREVGRRLAQGPTIAYALLRQGVRDGLDGTLAEALALERANQALAGETRDFAEGVQAFGEKRPPQFEGR